MQQTKYNQLVLHAGMPKSGSSALQAWLDQHRERLRENFVYYPEGAINRHNHLILMGGAGASPRFLQYLSRKKGIDVEQEFENFIKRVHEQSLNYTQTILSCELIFGLNEDQIEVLSRRLREVFSEIHVVLYLRSPSSYYLSSTQQVLKFSSNIKAPAAPRYRDKIEQIQRAFGSVDVHSYNDLAGDIAEHFLSTHTTYKSRPDNQVTHLSRNLTASAEAMALLQQYRRYARPNADDVVDDESRAVVKMITAADKHIEGYQRPKLREPIRSMIDRSAIDLVWLQQEFGLAFEDVEYDTIKEKRISFDPTSVEDICEINHNRKTQLLSEVLRRVENKLDPTRAGQIIKALSETGEV